jgi:tetratricopeptide (TPR) repeat protein
VGTSGSSKTRRSRGNRSRDGGGSRDPRPCPPALLATRDEDKHCHGSLVLRNLDMVVMVVIILVLCMGTYARNEVWNSDSGLWADVVKKSPNKARGYANTIGALVTEGRYEEAKQYGARAMRLKDKPYYLYYNIATAYHHLRDLTTAYKYARKAVDMEKDQATMYQLGLVLRDMGWKVGDPSPAGLEE